MLRVHEDGRMLQQPYALEALQLTSGDTLGLGHEGDEAGQHGAWKHQPFPGGGQGCWTWPPKNWRAFPSLSENQKLSQLGCEVKAPECEHDSVVFTLVSELAPSACLSQKLLTASTPGG